MKTKAAVAFESKKPLEVVDIDLEGPKEGEVLVEIKATGICHTDEFTLSGADPEGIFPAVLGHEGAGIVVDVGSNVKSVKEGDHVIPLYTPECQTCNFCLNPKTNLCQAIRVTQGRGLMPDGSSRFSYKGKQIFHYMGTSTFSNYTVLPEIALAKINKAAAFDTACYVGCGVTTGIGAVIFTAWASLIWFLQDWKGMIWYALIALVCMKHALLVMRTENTKSLDSELKKVALMAFVTGMFMLMSVTI